jgi:hypothetical protein
MNKRLEHAVARVMALPEAQQGEIAELLIGVLDQDSLEIELAPEQLAEIEQALQESEPYASDADVHAVFDRLAK